MRKPGSQEGPFSWFPGFLRGLGTVLLALALVLPAVSALAQTARPPSPADLEGKPVREIIFEGARRHSQAYYREQIRLKVGDPYPGRTALNDDVRRLFATGVVDSDATADGELVGGLVRVVFRITELDEVKEVEYEGLSTISDRELSESAEGVRLRAPLGERPGTTFSDFRARRDADTIQRMIREKGKFFAEVDVERKELEDGVKVIFHVREGPTVRVAEIKIVGNDHIPQADLQRFMRTQTTVLYFIRSGYFDPKTLEDDVRVIETYYWRDGWLDVRAMVEDLSFNAERDRVTVTFRVIEGERYRVRKLEISGLSIFKPEFVRKDLETKEGEFFSGASLAKDLETIQKLYRDKGYIFSAVDFRRRLVAGERAVDLLFAVEQGVKVTVEKIRFEGNTRTRDDVIRRELSLLPGEPFSAELMDDSKDRLGRRGYFRDLRIAFEPGTADHYRDLVVRLDEADTGSLQFGGGLSSSSGVFARILFAQRNFDLFDVPTSIDDLVEGHLFVGGGQTLLISAEPGQKRTRVSVTFVEPYFLPDHLPLPIQLRTTFSYYDSVLARSYEEQRLEAQLGLGYRIGRDSLLELAYRITDTSIFGIDPLAPADVIEVAGRNLVSAAGLSYAINRNKQDQNLLSYGGWGASAEVELAGGPFGGEYDFVRFDAAANVQHTLFTWPRDSKHVIGLRGNVGAMSEYGRSESVPIFERYYAGGPRSVRGFQIRSVGPQADDEPIGGKARMVGSLEYGFPIVPGFDQTYSPEWRADFLRGVVFLDAGNVEAEIEDFTFDEFRVSTGFGLRIKVPIFPAPIALDFGFPLRKKEGDDEETFSFSVGVGGP